MSIRDWTRGQIVIFWLSLAVVTFWISFAYAVFASSDGDEWEFLLLGWAFAFALASLPALVVTWVWVGRNRPRHPSGLATRLPHRWLVGIGVTMIAGWRMAGWQGQIGIARVGSAVAYPLWVFALVAAVLWWSQRTRRHVPAVMAVFSVVMAYGNFLIANRQNGARGEDASGTAVIAPEPADLDPFEDLRAVLQAIPYGTPSSDSIH